MRGFLALVFTVALISTFIAGIEMLLIEGRTGGTVFQQIVARVTFGLSGLVCTVAAGFLAVTGQSRAANERIETALKDIAASNADSAQALKSIDGFAGARMPTTRAGGEATPGG